MNAPKSFETLASAALDLLNVWSGALSDEAREGLQQALDAGGRAALLVVADTGGVPTMKVCVLHPFDDGMSTIGTIRPLDMATLN